jgi:hypothetical protein
MISEISSIPTETYRCEKLERTEGVSPNRKDVQESQLANGKKAPLIGAAG